MRNIQLAANLPMSAPQIVDITDQLPRRKKWEQVTRIRKPEEITTIVVHHSGPPNGTLKSHAEYHASRWGAGIAYHICIDKGGIYQVNNLLDMTYHAANNNSYTIGIEVNRDLTGNDMTDDERSLLYAAILTVKSLFPSIKDIRGHRELPHSATSCPQTSEKRIRADIAALEEQMAYNATPSADRVQAYALAERVQDLSNKLTNQTWGQAARDKLMMLAPAVESLGKPAGSAEEIAEATHDLYGKALKGSFQDEATRKLLVIAAMAKEKGLL